MHKKQKNQRLPAKLLKKGSGVVRACISKITAFCIRKRIIKAEDAVWFQYGLEKRVSTILVAFPFFVLAVVLTNVVAAVFFYISFYWLRARTNGHHSKTIIGCFVISLLLDGLFCGVLYPLLNCENVLIFMTFSVIAVFLLAPYNHPNIKLSKEAIVLCRKHARWRICCLSGITSLAMLTDFFEIAKGIALGSAMASLMLCVPYILEKGVVANE